MLKTNIKIIATVFALIVALLSPVKSDAQDFKKILSGLSGKNNESGTGNSDDKNKLGDILSAVGKTVAAEVKYSTLVGEWEYTGAAVGFQSENLLKQAGGAAAATALEKKITPYYQKAGLTSAVIVFNSDSTFTMTIKKVKLSGNVAKGTAKNCYEFNFKAMGKVKLGKLNGFIVSEGVKTISLTFDASKLIALVDKVASMSGNASIQSVSKLLSSYDGCTLGFKMKQTSTEEKTK